ncbi:four-jointed box protein 1-like [Asterias rubens]|uniref:four-jointed box protein 1-like n=1 Tax=Asterias rubens TaxID=7604 RepID=UPI0014553597|nr:four-jointed box protein 1-like [Asterias rubens]XP_033645673.1 four-jointed box protein 1-like [Asterias rubens]XP_033645674.1 four-jointed box protein 1-like [Asterias rubens]
MRSLTVFGGIFECGFCLSLFLCHAAASYGDGSVHLQGKFSLDVNLQREFDKTVSEVKNILNFTDKELLDKLNHTIYKGLLNHVIRESGYLAEFHSGIPEADDNMVNELEKAGFVVLANLAKKDVRGGASIDTVLTSESDGACAPLVPHVEGGGRHRGFYTKPSATRNASEQLPHKVQHHNKKSTLLDPVSPLLDPVSSAQLDSRSGSKAAKDTNSIGSEHKKPAEEQGQTENDFNLILEDPLSKVTHRDTQNTMQDDRGVSSASDNNRLVNKEGLPILEDDLYWSEELEEVSPKGFSQLELEQWKQSLSSQTVQSVEPGNPNKCGREKNRFLVLNDGTRLCARYRHPLITSMTGELYSFHLGRMLGMTNLPPLHVSIATTNDTLWSGLESHFNAAEWEDGRMVLLTKWIEDLGGAFFPDMLVTGPFPVGSNYSQLRQLRSEELLALHQWSDLLVFDFLIAHFDRLTINLAGVRYYDDISILRTQVHNLVQHPQTKQLWIVDNESGLLDGYSFLQVENKDSLLHSELQKELLQKICIFRRSTVERVRALLEDPNPARLLTERVLREDPLSRGVFPEFDKIHKHGGMLRERLQIVHSWMESCQKQNIAKNAGESQS